jgi:hypothetical protein
MPQEKKVKGLTNYKTSHSAMLELFRCIYVDPKNPKAIDKTLPDYVANMVKALITNRNKKPSEFSVPFEHSMLIGHL